MLDFDEVGILKDHDIQSIGVRMAQDDSTRSIKACFDTGALFPCLQA